MCTYVPEEVVYAAGFLPVRIVGSHEADSVTAPFLFNMFCSHCRDILAQGLLGKYDYLKGVLHATCCEKIRNAFDSWGRHISGMKMYYLYMPQLIRNRGTISTFTREIRRLKEQLELDWGINISHLQLENSISVYNENRYLMRQVYELMKEEKPRIQGEELFSMVLAGQVMDKIEHSNLIREFLEVVETRKGVSAIRTMIVGQTDNIRLIRLLDSMGAGVVVDESCFGIRYFWNNVSNEDDQLAAIARRYVQRPPCPVKDGNEPRQRIPFISELAREYQVSLAIMIHPKFCDPHSFDTPIIKDMLQKQGIKVLELEEDFTMPIGQVRSRIEATLELFELNVA